MITTKRKEYCYPALCIRLSCGVFASLVCLSGNASAQVISDGSVGSTVSAVGNNYTINNGTQVGSNLFHSFSQFSVPTGGAANFNNAGTVQNIFARVTGGSVSSIDGLLKTNGSASLFLLNPSGILFGPNASLNIGGSFIASTADSVIFADGVKFTTESTAPALLTVSVPVGLQMGANAGAITVQGPQPPSFFSGLMQFTPGKTLALVGSDINIVSANLLAADGQIELWAIRNAEITLSSSTGWQLASSPATATWGDISLRQSSFVNAGGTNGGAIQVRAKGLTVQDGSSIVASTTAGQGKGITVQTTEFINLLGVSAPGQSFFPGIQTSVGNSFGFGPPATGKAGNIRVETKSLQISNSGWLSSITTGNNSQTGDITIKASDIIISGGNQLTAVSPAITNLILLGKNNTAGQITIDAQNISLIDSGRISSDLFQGSGSAGNISIRVAESFKIQGTNSSGVVSSVFSSLQPGTTGQGGQISIDAGSLILTQGGAISAGMAGASNFLGVPSPGATGTGGNINIWAGEVQVSDPIVDPTGLVSGITVSVGQGAEGSGGNINLNANTLKVFNGGQITSSSQGQGSAGSVNLNVNTIDVQGISQSLVNGQYLPSAITASSATAFDAGSVNITADTLQVRDAAQITVSNTGTGDAGNLNINSRSIFLDNGASLRAEVTAGSQGNINLQARDILLLRHGSNITTNAQGAASGGNITINAGFVVGVSPENSDIVANAVKGRGGNIQITTNGIYGLKFRPQLTPLSDITASSQFGVSGTVQISDFNLDPTSGLVQLPAGLVDPSQKIATGCAANKGNSFVATGRGGLPPNPTQDVNQARPWTDTRDISAYQRSGKTVDQAASPNPSQPAILEATTWQRNPDGSVELVAIGSAAYGQVPITCAAIPSNLGS